MLNPGDYLTTLALDAGDMRDRQSEEEMAVRSTEEYSSEDGDGEEGDGGEFEAHESDDEVEGRLPSQSSAPMFANDGEWEHQYKHDEVCSFRWSVSIVIHSK